MITLTYIQTYTLNAHEMATKSACNKSDRMLKRKLWQIYPFTALDSEPVLCTDSDCWVVTLPTPPLILTERDNCLGFTPGSRICVREKPLPMRGKRKVSSDSPVARTGDLIATTEVLIIPIRNKIEI